MTDLHKPVTRLVDFGRGPRRHVVKVEKEDAVAINPESAEVQGRDA